MTLPLTLPEWMPEWLGLILLLVGLVYGLAMLAMPFSVFGVKSRLEAIEEQLDQVQEELRVLTMRLPEPLRGVAIDETPYDPLPRSAAAHYELRRPAPEPTREPVREPIREPGREPVREPISRSRPVVPPPPPPRTAPGRRIEPRLD